MGSRYLLLGEQERIYQYLRGVSILVDTDFSSLYTLARVATPYRFAAVSLVFIPILDRTVLNIEFFILSLGPPAPIVEKGVIATEWRSPIASP